MTTINTASGEKKLVDNEYLLSIFKLNSFSTKDESLFKNYVFSELYTPKSYLVADCNPKNAALRLKSIFEEFFDDFKDFNKFVMDLDRRLLAIINRAFDDCNSLTSIYKVYYFI